MNQYYEIIYGLQKPESAQSRTFVLNSGRQNSAGFDLEDQYPIVIEHVPTFF